MITWVTVWVLTVVYVDSYKSSVYQLTYAKHETCLNALQRHKKKTGRSGGISCDFQQIPVVTK